MDELAARTGRRYGLVDYHGAPDAERVDRAHGLGGRRGRGDRRHAERRRRARSACCACGSSARSRPRSSSPRCRRRCARSPCSTAPRSRARSASRSTSTSLAALDRSDGRRRAAVRAAPAGDRRPLRPVVEGVHAVDGQAGLRRAGGDRPKRHFTVGIYDDVTHLSLPIDHELPLPAPGRRGAGGVLRARRRTARSAPTRRR